MYNARLKLTPNPKNYFLATCKNTGGLLGCSSVDSTSNSLSALPQALSADFILFAWWFNR